MSLPSAKTQLTKACKFLTGTCDEIQENLNGYKALSNVDLPSAIEDIRADYKTLERSIDRASKMMTTLESVSDSIVASTNTELNDDEIAAMQTYADNFAEANEVAQKLLTNLEIIMDRHERAVVPNRRTTGHNSNMEDLNERIFVERSTLPLPKLPKFDGTLSQYQNFKSLFMETVHSSGQSPTLKMNHLVNSLTGEPHHLISKVLLRGENYQAALDILDKKYGDQRKTVTSLIRKLKDLNAKSEKTRDQRDLLDSVQITVSQLTEMKEPLETIVIQDMIIEKFSQRIQREIFRTKLKRQKCHDADVNTSLNSDNSTQSTEWSIEIILNQIEDIVSTEEELDALVPRDKKKPDQGHQKGENPSKGKDSKTKFSKLCHACSGKDHWTYECKKFPDPAKRTAILISGGKCAQCARSDHVTSKCTSAPCKWCNEPGHFSANCTKKQSANNSSNSTSSTQQTKSSTNSAKGSSNQSKPKGGKNHTVSVITTGLDLETDVDTKTSAFHAFERPKRSAAIIPTVKVSAFNPQSNSWEKITLMLDTGADASYISQKLAENWKLPIIDSKTFAVKSFNDLSPTAKRRDQTSLELMTNCKKPLIIKPFIESSLVGKIGKNPILPQDLAYCNLLDLEINEQCHEDIVEPDVIIGGNYFNRITHGAPQTLPSGITLMDTIFGHTIMGCPVEEQSDDEVSQNNSIIPDRHQFTMINSLNNSERDVEEAQKKEMKVTSPGEFTGPLAEEIKEAEKLTWSHFKKTIEKREDGYYVRFHIKEGHPNLPDNFSICLKRLKGVKRNRSREVLTMIDKIFADQIEKGILEYVPKSRHRSRGSHYNPHDPVLTPTKTTTKCRVVVDGGAHFVGEISLNDIIHQGPTILPSLVDLLLRFRSGLTIIISDVEKAFLQVFLHEDDRDLVRVLWVRDIDEEFEGDNIIELRFTRVLFGINASPFLLGATILHHLEQLEDQELAREMANNLYVDNLIQTTDKSAQEAFALYRGAKDAFSGLCMNLREFQTNSQELFELIDTVDRATDTIMKVLGISWDSQTDLITMKVSFEILTSNSRRTICRAIAEIFDPLGLMSPILLPARLFQRELWEEEFGYEWDTPLVPKHELQWMAIIEAASGFDISLPRNVIQKSNKNIIVTFTDASKDATSCCIYAVNELGANILFGKSKVKNLKEVFTIPKMEMQALKMGTERTEEVVKALLEGQITVTDIFIFTDSAIALAWLKSQPSQKEVGVFVRNRLTAIRDITARLESSNIPVKFGHVVSEENPADLGTRGANSENFSQSIWWKGPQFLNDDPSTWTSHGLFSIIDEQAEIIHHVTFAYKSAGEPLTSVFDCSRTYSYQKMMRVVAYSMKFIKRYFQKCSVETQQKLIGSIPAIKECTSNTMISAEEIRNAEVALIRDHQRGSFNEKLIKKWKNLNLTVNEIGLIISQGRLGHSELENESKFPIMIAPNSDLAIQIVWMAHSKFHKSTDHTIAGVMEKFWIPKLRQLVKKLRKTCVPCQRTMKAPFLYPNMGHVPENRVRRARPYEHIGLDYFGPMKYRISSSEIGTSFGVIFTCAVTRLTHMDVAPNYSTTAFIQALRRFVALHGVPSSIVSDNAPAHILGEKMINESIIKETEKMDPEIIEFLGTHAIKWKFNTPYAPWQGGFFERLIRIVKEHLVRSIRTSILSYEELRTVFMEIASSMNSRPLTMTMSDDPHSRLPIKPLDFICPGRPVTIPVMDCEEVDEYLPSVEAQANSTRRETIQALESSMLATQNIWNRWQKEYLVQLRAHHKARMDNKKGTLEIPKIGQVVIICDEMLPRNYWRLGIITELVDSTNHEIREVLIETITGKNQDIKSSLRRAVNQVVPLELDGYEADSETTQTEEAGEQETNSDLPVAQPEQRYNLRQRKPVDYNEDLQRVAAASFSFGIPFHSAFLYLCTMFLIMGTAAGQGAQLPTHAVCIPTGIQIRGYYDSFEACVKDYCTSRSRLQWTNTDTVDVWIPPHLKTSPHHATVKIFDGHDLKTWELECQSVNVCDTIDCTFCLSNILNPECHLIYAIMGLGFTTFLTLFMIYALCFVPVKIVSVLKLGANLVMAVWTFTRSIVAYLWKKAGLRKRPINRFRTIAVIAALIIILPLGQACQEIDFTSALQQSCTEIDGKEKCETFTEVSVNLNQINLDGCIRISKNGTHHWDIRLQLEEVSLSCTKETITITQDVDVRVWSTKRCDTAGSCDDGKCTSINSDSLLPELQIANGYTGFTRCSESCGGFGCGCFFPSSGCLFYRVFAIPKTPQKYEVFRCMDYTTTAVVKLTSIRLSGLKNTMRDFDLPLTIGAPVAHSKFVVTLDTVWTPPSPALNTWFIRKENETATWLPNHLPAYTCGEDATNCTLKDTCKCSPAEDTMMCSCEQDDLRQWFAQTDRRLPVHQGHWKIQSNNDKVIAQMHHGATATLTIKLHDEWRTTQYHTKDMCTVIPSAAIGCYSCENGATSEVLCTADTTETFASVKCGDDLFAIKCTINGVATNLTFYANYAAFTRECTVSCGGEERKFHIQGTLKFTASIWTSIDRFIFGNTTVYDEWNLPDIGHIFTEYLSMIKTVAIVLIVVVAIFLLTYSIIVAAETMSQSTSSPPETTTQMLNQAIKALQHAVTELSNLEISCLGYDNKATKVGGIRQHVIGAASLVVKAKLTVETAQTPFGVVESLPHQRECFPPGSLSTRPGLGGPKNRTVAERVENFLDEVQLARPRDEGLPQGPPPIKIRKGSHQQGARDPSRSREPSKGPTDASSIKSVVVVPKQARRPPRKLCPQDYESPSWTRKCCFCSRHHKSDLCGNVTTQVARHQLAEKEHICKICLSIGRAKHRCQADKTCRYCLRSGHAEAFCPHPINKKAKVITRADKMNLEVHLEVEAEQPLSQNAVDNDDDREELDYEEDDVMDEEESDRLSDIL